MARDKASIAGKTETYKVFINGTDYIGLAKVTLPETELASEDVKGAGIGGVLPMPSLHVNKRTCKIDFTAPTALTYQLYRPGKHILDLRHVINTLNTASGAYEYSGRKHLLHAVTTKMADGELDAGTKPGGSWEGGVLYQKTTVDDKAILEIDPANNIYKVDGVDYYAEIRKKLGA